MVQLSRRTLVKGALATSALTIISAPSFSQSRVAYSGAERFLEDQFRDPPSSARPRVWWHWMNGNITQDGIAKDLAWMQRVGIGGVQTFDANLQSPQIVEQRLVYMTPEWKDAFRFAASEADRLDLELAIASSPGWSITGGPWVKPEDGLKKLVWSETEVIGGVRFAGQLAAPPTVTGPYQSLAMPVSMGVMGSGNAREEPPTYYADVAVLALPLPARTRITPVLLRADGSAADGSAISGDDRTTSYQIEGGGSVEAPRAIGLQLTEPQTIRSARIFAPDAIMPLAGALFRPRLEAARDGTDWRTIAEFPLGAIPTTVAFSPVTAQHFRLVLQPRLEALASLTQYGPVVLQRMGIADPASIFARPVKIADLQLSTEDRIDFAEAKAAFELVPNYFALSSEVPDVQGVDPGQVIDLTSRLQPDGTLDWLAPSGRWMVLRLGYSLVGTTNHPATPEATGLEVDKFDAGAVRRYMEHYLGMYRDASGGLMGDRGIRALLTDSTEIGAANWTPRIIEHFQRLRGYDPLPWLPAMTGTIIGSREQSDRFLYDFRRTLAELHASEHYGTIAAVAHENGLTVYGEALEDKRPVIGDDMAMRRHADIPMAAMWAFSSEQGPRVTLLADIKGAASVAHIYGQNLVAAESLTAAGPPWGYGPADLKRVIDLEFVLGVNRPIIHTSVHAPTDDKLPGLSLGGIGQYFNRHETWGEMAKPWIDYIARNSFMLQQGRHVADVAYFYGEEAPLTGLYGERPVSDAPTAYAYDFINADALTGALENDQADLLTPGGARYRAMYLGGSSDQMTLPVLRKIVQLVEGGATVIGRRPHGNPSLAQDAAEWNALVGKLWAASGPAQVGNGRVIDSTNVEAGLRAIGVAPDFHFTSGRTDTEILFLHRELADGHSYFVSNRLARDEAISAHFRVTGKVPELWYADTGKSEPVSYSIENGETVVPLSLPADGSVHVVFRKPATAAVLTIEKDRLVEVAHLQGPWNVTFQPGRGAPASVAMPELTPLNLNSDPGIAHFSGIATYRMAFDTPRDWMAGQPLWLDLGEVREIAELSVNGEPAGHVWHAPYHLEIGELIVPGTNFLEVKVANLWVNRLIGDAQPDVTPITWTGLMAYGPDAHLRRSGLIGPVKLLRPGT